MREGRRGPGRRRGRDRQTDKLATARGTLPEGPDRSSRHDRLIRREV